MKAALTWVGGIVSAVLIAYLSWYLTRPPVPVPPTTFDGMVIDKAQTAPIPKAMVTVNIQGSDGAGEFYDFTDEHGSYRFDFEALEKSATVNVSVQANGYQKGQPAAIPVLNVNNRHDFLMEPVPRPTPPAGVPVVPPAAVTPAAHLPLFVPKMMQQKVNLKAVLKH
jgi:hypothetical protein